MIFNFGYYDIKFGAINGYAHEKMLTIITVCVVVVTLLLVGSLIFNGHDHDDEHDYGYVEELYEKLEYISQCIDELEKRLEE